MKRTYLDRKGPPRTGWFVPERLESRKLMTVLGLDSGVVKADGRIVQLVFKGPLDASKPGVPDWAQSQAAGSQITLSNGAVLEPLGSVVTKDATSLTWTSTFLITDPSLLVTFNTPSIQVSAPAGLLTDPSGNTTAALNRVTVVNHSLVDANGFTTRSFQPGTVGVAVYVSSTFGNDSRTVAQASDPSTPFRTPAAAANALHALKVNGKGVAIRLLRGDVFDGGLSLDYG